MADETPSSSSRIFISYRRDDSEGHVLALHQKLREHFGDRIFKDTDNIAPGQDFAKVITNELRTCSVLLAVIGKEWVTAEDAKANRRLDNPNDYLRLEISTALKNEHVLVIPVLVQGARMPEPEVLPEELGPLSRRNAIELSGGRWNSDVDRLISAIERASGMSQAPRRQAPPPPVERHPPPPEPQTEEIDLFEIRRRREIAEHVRAAQQAFEAGDFESVIESAEKALFRDPNAGEARALIKKARTALDEQKIDKWLSRAQEILKGEALADTDLAAASDLIDQALALIPTHEAAGKLRQDVLHLRKRRERQREVERQVQAIVARAQKCFDDEDYDAAIEYCDDALTLPVEAPAARDLRARAVAAKEEERRQRELKKRAQLTVKEAREEFAAGKHEAALARLQEFSPSHDLVDRAIEELRDEMDARALGAVAAARRQFAAGEREAAVARLEEFRPAHAAVTRAIGELRAELQQIADRQKQEEAARRRDEEARAAAARLRQTLGEKLGASAAALARREFDAALAVARAALELDPESREARTALAAAEAAVARQKEVATGLRDVRALLEAARFPAALEALAKIAALDPQAEGLAALREEVQAQQDARDAKAREEAKRKQDEEARKAKEKAEQDARDAKAREEARRRQDEEARKAKEKAEQDARDAKAREEAKRKQDEEARKAKEKAEQDARDAKAREEAKRKQDEEARKAKEKAEQDARDAKAREEVRRKQDEEARKAKEKAEQDARDAKAREEARRKQDEEARKAKEPAAPAEEPAVEPEPAKRPIVAIVGGIAAIAAAILLVVWMSSGPADTPGTPPTTTSTAPSNAETAKGEPASTPPATSSTVAESKPTTTAPPPADASPNPSPTGEPSAPSAALPLDPRVAELQRLRTAANEHWLRAEWQATMSVLRSAIKVAPEDQETRALAINLMRQARDRMGDAAKAARDARAESTRPFRDGEGKAQEADRLAGGRGVNPGPRTRPVEAFRAYNEAIDLFKKAAAEAPPAPVVTAPPPAADPPANNPPPGSIPKPLAPPPNPNVTPVAPPVETVKPPPSSPIKPPPTTAATSTPPAVTPSAPPVSPWVADEAAIRKALQAYEAALNKKDLAALKRVWNYSKDEEKGLKGTFDRAKEYGVTVTVTNVAPLPDGRQANATATVVRVFDPKSAGDRNVMNNTIAFLMQKTEIGWIITKVTTVR